MSEHPNEVRVREGVEAFARGDLTALEGFLSEDLLWHQAGRNALSGDYRGRDAVIGIFAKIFEITGGTFRIELLDVLASDDHAVVFVRQTGEHDGRQLDTVRVVAFKISEGKATEYWSLADDQDAEDAFLS